MLLFCEQKNKPCCYNYELNEVCLLSQFYFLH